MPNHSDEKVSHLRDSVTQSATDTYTEATINTNINPLSNQLIEIHDVKFEITTTPALIGTRDHLDMVLLKQSKTAMPNIDDSDVICKWKLYVDFSTNGGGFTEITKHIHFDPPELIAVDELVLGMDSGGQDAAKSGSVDIRYTPRKVSDGEFAKLAKF